MQIRWYIPKDLSNENKWPDGAHYQTILDRIKKNKYIEIFYFTKHKTPEKRSLFLPYEVGNKIQAALEFYDQYQKGEITIVKK